MKIHTLGDITAPDGDEIRGALLTGSVEELRALGAMYGSGTECAVVPRTEPDALACLAQIVASAREFGVDQVSLGVSDQAVDILVGIPGAKARTTIYREPKETYAIDSVRVDVNGVEVRAQRRSRPATPEEEAALQREDASDHRTEYRAVIIKDTGNA